VFAWNRPSRQKSKNIVLLSTVCRSNFHSRKDKIHFPDPSAIKFLEGRERTFLIDLLKSIREEISLGTLSLD
jgi:hypothetical protein